MINLKERVFNILIKDYLKRGRPVGSKYLHKFYLKNISHSTIRWYLRKLTKEELLINSKKNDGRIPTDKGWRFYFERNLNNKFRSTQFKLLKKNNENEIFDSLLKRFNLYGIIFYNSTYFIESGLDYIIRNIEFNNKIYFVGLAYLIKNIKINNKINIKNNDDISILIGKEIGLLRCENFSVFTWQNFNKRYFLLSVKRINYPQVYNLIKINFKNGRRKITI
ncbi:MAG: hypothetical protein KatS3mg094_193 [Candidatus Parcubacteria bacterium]|nr:MAG: hypothetical protein KatS3mg094_193 [Candidatus Parcubacteria bacterium]